MQDKRSIIKFIVLVLCVFFLTSHYVSANTVDPVRVSNAPLLGFLGATAYLKDASIGSVSALAIKSFLSLLGLVFLVLILYAGYSWMTARGDEQQVTKAKDTIQRAAIGLAVVLAAYAITYFVFLAFPFGDNTVTSIDEIQAERNAWVTDTEISTESYGDEDEVLQMRIDVPETVEAGDTGRTEEDLTNTVGSTVEYNESDFQINTECWGGDCSTSENDCWIPLFCE